MEPKGESDLQKKQRAQQESPRKSPGLQELLWAHTHTHTHRELNSSLLCHKRQILPALRSCALPTFVKVKFQDPVFLCSVFLWRLPSFSMRSASCNTCMVCPPASWSILSRSSWESLPDGSSSTVEEAGAALTFCKKLLKQSWEGSPTVLGGIDWSVFPLLPHLFWEAHVCKLPHESWCWTMLVRPCPNCGTQDWWVCVKGRQRGGRALIFWTYWVCW